LELKPQIVNASGQAVLKRTETLGHSGVAFPAAKLHRQSIACLAYRLLEPSCEVAVADVICPALLPNVLAAY
jgi:hypothetical protein